MMLTQVAEVAVEFFHSLFVRLGTFALQALVELKHHFSHDPRVDRWVRRICDYSIPSSVYAPHA